MSCVTNQCKVTRTMYLIYTICYYMQLHIYKVYFEYSIQYEIEAHFKIY